MERRVRMRIAALDTTARAVSEAAEMSQSSFHDIITGTVDARSSSLRRIEAALGVPEGWLSKDVDLGELGQEAGAFPPPEWLRVQKEASDAPA